MGRRSAAQAEKWRKRRARSPLNDLWGASRNSETGRKNGVLGGDLEMKTLLSNSKRNVGAPWTQGGKVRKKKRDYWGSLGKDQARQAILEMSRKQRSRPEGRDTLRERSGQAQPSFNRGLGSCPLQTTMKKRRSRSVQSKKAAPHTSPSDVAEGGEPRGERRENESLFTSDASTTYKS